MLTKAYIIDKIKDSNKYQVRIPSLEEVGNNEELSNIVDTPLYEATLSYNPGSLDTYQVGDIVFVQFEDNDFSKVVIVGKLYLGEEETPSGYQNTQALNVENEANLSDNTYIGGTKIDEKFLTRADFNNYQQLIDESIVYKIHPVD